MIPDDEPWWMVRRTADAIGDGYGGRQSMPRTCPLAAERDDREDIAEPTDFRPFGYEW
jgi:hypothetical protein